MSTEMVKKNRTSCKSLLGIRKHMTSFIQSYLSNLRFIEVKIGIDFKLKLCINIDLNTDTVDCI